MSKKSGDSCLSILFKMTVLMVILVVVVVGGVYFAYLKLNDFFNRGGTVIVPDFRGQHIAEIIRSKPEGIEIVRRDEKYDDRHLKDHVIAQFPEPGTVVKPGKKVLLSISLGLQKVNVPDIVGANMREVDMALMNSQLVIGDRAYVFSDKIPPDRIVGQSPLPSEEYGVNKEVDLLISLGSRPESYPLPSLVAVSLDDGKTRLKAWGFNFGRIFSKKDPSRPKFQVISTTPAPYTPVRKGDVISMLVSSGDDEGTASAEDLQRFEVYAGAAAERMPDKPAQATSPTAAVEPPRILIAQDNISVPETPRPPQVFQPQAEREMSFVMPDGFMPKEVKFIHITNDGRQQLYAGAHKPLELVKVKVPVVPNSKVQIYINDVPIEERRVEP
ncbi:MAG: PASTA domain-containing protein [Candidatus Riflebacteria bacterium]|nr:PASTA domain-containing protein [Candidatus Riflebacteria bacterium]